MAALRFEPGPPGSRVSAAAEMYLQGCDLCGAGWTRESQLTRALRCTEQAEAEARTSAGTELQGSAFWAEGTEPGKALSWEHGGSFRSWLESSWPPVAPLEGRSGRGHRHPVLCAPAPGAGGLVVLCWWQPTKSVCRGDSRHSGLHLGSPGPEQTVGGAGVLFLAAPQTQLCHSRRRPGDPDRQGGLALLPSPPPTLQPQAGRLKLVRGTFPKPGAGRGCAG